jgi:hypothetical protein
MGRWPSQQPLFLFTKRQCPKLRYSDEAIGASLVDLTISCIFFSVRIAQSRATLPNSERRTVTSWWSLLFLWWVFVPLRETSSRQVHVCYQPQDVSKSAVATVMWFCQCSLGTELLEESICDLSKCLSKESQLRVMLMVMRMLLVHPIPVIESYDKHRTRSERRFVDQIREVLDCRQTTVQHDRMKWSAGSNLTPFRKVAFHDGHWTPREICFVKVDTESSTQMANMSLSDISAEDGWVWFQWQRSNCQRIVRNRTSIILCRACASGVQRKSASFFIKSFYLSGRDIRWYRALFPWPSSLFGHLPRIHDAPNDLSIWCVVRR